MRRPEQAMQIAVFDHLRARVAPGVVAWHTPNGGWRIKAEAAILHAMGDEACRESGLDAAAILEIVVWLALLQMLHRLSAFYRA